MATDELYLQDEGGAPTDAPTDAPASEPTETPSEGGTEGSGSEGEGGSNVESN